MSFTKNGIVFKYTGQEVEDMIHKAYIDAKIAGKDIDFIWIGNHLLSEYNLHVFKTRDIFLASTKTSRFYLKGEVLQMVEM